MAKAQAVNVTALVIGRFDLGEADRIVTIFSLEQGKLRASARGVRRITSRLAGHLELFSHSELWIHPGKSLDSITSAKLLAGPVPWLDRPDRVSLAYIMAQLLDRLSAEGEAQPELYNLALELHNELPGATPSPILELAFKLRFLDQLGLRPILDGCSVCGTPTTSTESYRIDAERGGLVCSGCNTGGYPIDERTIKFWRMALGLPFASLGLIRDAAQLSIDSLELIDIFYEYNFDRRFTGLPITVN